MNLSEEKRDESVWEKKEGPWRKKKERNIKSEKR